MRLSFKRLSERIPLPSFPSVQGVTTAGGTYSVPFAAGDNGATDAPADNEVMKENKDEIDFAENVFASVPSGLKVEVEGGDANTPPGFEEK